MLTVITRSFSPPMYPALRTGTYRTPEAVSGLPASPRGGNLVARSDHDRRDAAPVQTAVDAAVARSGSPTGAHETLRGPRCVRLRQSLAAVKTMWNDRLAIVPVVVRETHATRWPRPFAIRGLTRNRASEPQRRKEPANEYRTALANDAAHRTGRAPPPSPTASPNIAPRVNTRTPCGSRHARAPGALAREREASSQIITAAWSEIRIARGLAPEPVEVP